MTNERAQLLPAQENAVKETVRRVLKDPDSARFGEIYGRVWKGETAICGTVNAKNSYGGYVGSMPFWGTIKAGSFELGALASNEKESLQTKNVCVVTGVPLN